MNKKIVGIIGAGVTLAGLLTVASGIQSIRYYNGEMADLGAGPGAILVGLMCIGLSVHPRSPLRN